MRRLAILALLATAGCASMFEVPEYNSEPIPSPDQLMAELLTTVVEGRRDLAVGLLAALPDDGPCREEWNEVAVVSQTALDLGRPERGYDHGGDLFRIATVCLERRGQDVPAYIRAQIDALRQGQGRSDLEER